MKTKYNSYEGECLIVVWAISSFQCYFYGSPFILVTNHQPLNFLMELDNLTRKFARWAIILQKYDFHIVHRISRVNWDVNRLNWNPSSNEEDTYQWVLLAWWQGFGSSYKLTCLYIPMYLVGIFFNVLQINMGNGGSLVMWTLS